MKYYFCLVDRESAKSGTNLGRDYIYKHRSEWVDGPENIYLYLTAGYVKGVDYVTFNNKAYMLLKSYIDLNEGFVVILCTESVSGCDN